MLYFRCPLFFIWRTPFVPYVSLLFSSSVLFLSLSPAHSSVHLPLSISLLFLSFCPSHSCFSPFLRLTPVSPFRQLTPVFLLFSVSLLSLLFSGSRHRLTPTFLSLSPSHSSVSLPVFSLPVFFFILLSFRV